MDEVPFVNKRVIPPKRFLNAVKRVLFIPETGIKRRDINGRALNFGAVSDKRHLCLERKNAFRLENGRFYGWERFVVWKILASTGCQLLFKRRRGPLRLMHGWLKIFAQDITNFAS